MINNSLSSRYCSLLGVGGWSCCGVGVLSCHSLKKMCRGITSSGFSFKTPQIWYTVLVSVSDPPLQCKHQMRVQPQWCGWTRLVHLEIISLLAEILSYSILQACRLPAIKERVKSADDMLIACAALNVLSMCCS